MFGLFFKLKCQKKSYFSFSNVTFCLYIYKIVNWILDCYSHKTIWTWIMIQSAKKTFIKTNIAIVAIIIILYFYWLRVSFVYKKISLFQELQYIIKFSVIGSVLSCVSILMYFCGNLNVKGRRDVKARDEDEDKTDVSQIQICPVHWQVNMRGPIWTRLKWKTKTHFNWVWYTSWSVVYLSQC